MFLTICSCLRHFFNPVELILVKNYTIPTYKGRDVIIYKFLIVKVELIQQQIKNKKEDVSIERKRKFSYATVGREQRKFYTNHKWYFSENNSNKIQCDLWEIA